MRSYSAVTSPFDDGSQVEGLAWDGTRWVAMALAGSGGALGNSGAHVSGTSTDDVTWVAAGAGQLPTAPAEVADVVWSDFWADFYSAGRWDPSFWGVQPYGEWWSNLGTTWTRLARATTATFESAICVGPAGAFYEGTTVIGGQLNSGTGRLIANGFGTGPFTARSTPIDNQPFRVAQIAYDPDFNTFVAALVPVGVVSVAERIMISTNGGTTWSMASSPLDGAAAYGVCYSPNLPAAGTFVTGPSSVLFSDAGDSSGSWGQFNAPAGVHTAGKPCDANTSLIVPGGDTNDLSEFDFATFTFQSTKLTLMAAAKVAGYRPAVGLVAERVAVAGLGSPTGAIYTSFVAPPAADVPSLESRFDLG